MSEIVIGTPIEVARQNSTQSMERLLNDWPLSHATLPALFISSILYLPHDVEGLGAPQIELSMSGSGVCRALVRGLAPGVLPNSHDGNIFESFAWGVDRFSGGTTAGGGRFHALFERMHLVLGTGDSHPRWDYAFDHSRTTRPSRLASLPDDIAVGTEALVCWAQTSEALPAPTLKDANELKSAFEGWFHADIAVSRLG